MYSNSWRNKNASLLALKGIWRSSYSMAIGMHPASSINMNMSSLCLVLLLLLRRAGGEDEVAITSPTQTQTTLVTDPAVNIFFNIQDLRPGFTSLFYFSTDNDDNRSLRLLSRAEADSIPFSSADLPALRHLFSFAGDSPQATAMESTLKQCELEPASGELRFCATSLESMLDFVRSVLVLGPIRVLTTKLVLKPSPRTSLQKYTIAAAPTEIRATGIVACHTLPYPYAVFYCHTHTHGVNLNRVFRIGLQGEDGARIDATAVCHMDTSQWDKDHVSFQLLHIPPGTTPVCHFLPPDNLLWASF